MVTKTSMNNNKGQYPNNYGAECYVLSTALVLNEIYQPTQFLVDNTCVFFRVMFRAKCKNEQMTTFPN